MKKNNQTEDEKYQTVKRLLKNLNKDSIQYVTDNDEEGQNLAFNDEKFEGLDEEIEQILSLLNTQGDDLSKLQSMLILLLKKYITSKQTKSAGLTKKELEKLLTEEVSKASKLILEEYKTFLKKDNLEWKKDSDMFLTTNALAKNKLKKLIKAFAVYEMYKVMTPRRIAGETKLDNFVHNVLSHGVKYATRFAGGRPQEIAGYSKQIKNTLKRQNVKNSQLLGR